MKTRLLRLRGHGFRSLVDDFVVEFPESGLCLIRGQNLDTGGSSGSGKSSLLLAIQLALGICPFPATALRSWGQEQDLMVELTLATAAGEVVVTRSPKLSLTVAGVKETGNSAHLEQRLQEILGVSGTLLEALTYRRQLSRGQFLSRTDSEKKEFLTELLGLGQVEDAVEVSRKLVQDLEAQDLVREQNIQAAQADLQLALEQVHNQPEPEASGPDLTLRVQALTKDIDGFQNRIQDLQRSVKSDEAAAQLYYQRVLDESLPFLRDLERQRLELMKKPYPEVPGAAEEAQLLQEQTQAVAAVAAAQVRDRDQQAQASVAVRALQARVQTAQTQGQEIERLRQEGLNLFQELEQLQQNRCPTCKQQWLQAGTRIEQIQNRLNQIGTTVDNLQAQVGACNIDEAKAQIQALLMRVQDPELALAQGRHQGIRQRLAVVSTENLQALSRFDQIRKLEIAELQRQEAEARARSLHEAQVALGNARLRIDPQRNQIEVLQDQMQQALSEKQGLESQVTAATVRNVQAQARRAQVLARVQDVDAALIRAQQEFKAADERLHQEQDFLALIGREGFLGCIFDEILRDISTETNRILSGIPNTAHISLCFRSESTTQKGKVNKTIVPCVRIGGVEAPVGAGCSGGQFSGVELAVDLAVATVIGRRTGAVPAWMILDEAMEGLGVTEKEGALATVKEAAADKLVLVVDHASETKELFQQVLTVSFSGGKSTVSG